MGDDIPANEGINRAVTLIAPKGCIVNPTEPSPVGAQIDCEQRIPDAIFGALAPVFPDVIVTAGNGADIRAGAENGRCSYWKNT